MTDLAPARATPLDDPEDPRGGGDAAGSGAMLVAAAALGYAIFLGGGTYGTGPLCWLGASIVSCLLAILLPSRSTNPAVANIFRGTAMLRLLAVAILLWQGTQILRYPEVQDADRQYGGATILLAFAGLCGVAGMLPLGKLGAVRLAMMLAAFAGACGLVLVVTRPPGIDVFLFQHDAAAALLHGKNFYAIRFPNIYQTRPDFPFYGPGVVDAHNQLTYGFPYLPLGLLMVLPGQLAGDLRYAHLAAVLIAAALMSTARRASRGAALAGAVFLVTPAAPFVLHMAWTEPQLILMFSLTMYCALRYPRLTPWVAGLFFATKQYTIFAVPLVPLLNGGLRPWRRSVVFLIKAGIIASAVTLPFALWNFHEFWRAVVQWQFVQPFRRDALSFLVLYGQWIRRQPPFWPPFAAVVPAIGLALWRCPRTPAGFAAACTFVYLVFFALNKQAFCNYYYFAVALACWSVAAGPAESFGLGDRERPAGRGFPVLPVDPIAPAARS